MSDVGRGPTMEEMKQQAARILTQGYSAPVCVGTPQERREINRLIDDLSDICNRYENLVARLSDRISAVTSIAPPECSNTKDIDRLATALGNDLESIRVRLRDSANNIDSIIDRIEL